MVRFLWHDEQYQQWVLTRPLDELKAGYESREAVNLSLCTSKDSAARATALINAHDSAITYITALEMALVEAQQKLQEMSK